MADTSKKKGGDGGFMLKVATFIVDRRNLFFLLFGLALIISVITMSWTRVENDLAAYLPDSAETSKGLDLMDEQFITYGTARVMVTNISYDEAYGLYERLDALDSIIMLDFDNSPDYYNNFSALYNITFGYKETDERALEALEEVKSMLDGYDIYVSTSMGDASAEQLEKEMQTISVLVAIVVVWVPLSPAGVGGGAGAAFDLLCVGADCKGHILYDGHDFLYLQFGDNRAAACTVGGLCHYFL